MPVTLTPVTAVLAAADLLLFTASCRRPHSSGPGSVAPWKSPATGKIYRTLRDLETAVALYSPGASP